MSASFRPARGLDATSAYRVPRHPAPTDLRLDGNEGRAPDTARLDPARVLTAERMRDRRPA